ncbi:MAG: phospholipid carrier-dependent glycosyltransferase, partial [Dehalococcoidales bacterium]|nr:phospholipid carrier-dependent glycosyltransferase [Dehalococcoidales bacterium]
MKQDYVLGKLKRLTALKILRNLLSLLRRFYHWEYFWLSIIVIASIVLQFAIIDRPYDLVLDEQHYVKEARNVISGHTIQFKEHPPLSKFFITLGMRIFGDNPVGWRFFAKLFGVTSTVLFYFICRRLNMSHREASIATFLLAFENMTFIQSSVAMLDVFLVFFMFITFLLYLSHRYISAGIAAGLTALTKITGAMAMPALILHWFTSPEKRSRLFAVTVVLSLISFFALMPLVEYLLVFDPSGVASPLVRLKDIVSLSSSLTFSNTTHESACRPWEWVFGYRTMPFWWEPHYISAISPSVWVMIVPAFGYMIYRAVRKRDEAGLFGASWFTSTYVLWIPLSLITNRISYPFYFYPSVGAICLGLGLGLSRLLDIFQTRKSGKLRWVILAFVILFFLVHIVSFTILYPP